MLASYRLRPMDTADLDLVRTWRNRADVREHAFTHHEIGEDEHRRYFAHALHDPSKRYLVCVDPMGQSAGVVYFTRIDTEQRVADWGFYAGGDAPKGIGTWLGYLGLRHAFEELRLDKVNAEVLDGNHRSVHLHQVLGFGLEGTFRAHHAAAGRRRDVHRFGLLHAEWDVRRPVIVRRLEVPGERPPFEPGHRETLALTLEPGEAAGRLLDRVVTALAGFGPGASTQVTHIDASIHAVSSGRCGELTIVVTRRVGDSMQASIRLTVPSDDTALLCGHVVCHVQ